MGYELHLRRLGADLFTPLPISDQEWEACCASISGIRIVTDGSFRTLETFSDQQQAWMPVFGLSQTGNGSIRATGLMGNDECYEKALETAEYLHAWITGDDSEVYFIPGYGTVVDNTLADGNPVIRLEDISRLGPVYQNDYAAMIEALVSETTTTNPSRQTPAYPPSPKYASKRRRISLVQGILLFLLCLIVYILIRQP